MPTRRGNKFYVKRTFPGVGSVYRSLGTESKERARQLEDMLKTLHDGGRADVVRAFKDGDLPIQTIAEYHESSRIHELVQKLAEPESVMLAAACRAALKYKSPDVKGSTYVRYVTGLDHFTAFVGRDSSVRDILNEERIQEFKAHRLAQGAAHQTVNNDLGAISILVTHALKRGWIDERPEIKRFPYLERIRYLEPDQLAAYMAVLRRPFRAQMQLLVGTGMRLGESEGLRVCDLRFEEDDRRALIEDAKTASGVRTVFVPCWAAEAVEAHIEEHGLSGTDPVFSILRRVVQSEHNRACKLAGIHSYVLHDHRHTAAVALARAGLPLHLLQRQLGHAHITQTMKYATFNPAYGDVSQYFDRVGERFGLGTPPSGNTSGNTPAEAGV